ncbi:hypothetical protein [Rhizobium sp. Root149]|uniref:hypothetical protein n=1 Tax=Rhizobium sp. Root149 TaxID=1736473 RepID=UPI000A996A08|nr:hypothetical protein [Rhizobium sp. Root149]
MNSMSFENYLAFKRTSKTAIRDAARLLANSNGEEIILAVGSVAEGLGNSKSDLDLLLLPKDDGVEEGAQAECSWVSGDCIVDMQILSASRMQALLARLEAWASEAWDVSRLAPFTTAELLLLHRLCTGVPLSGGKEEQTARGLLPDRDQVARLKLHTARHMARTVQVDMVGYQRLGDWHSLLYASQDLLGHISDGLLAAFRFTNPNPKWRSRLLHGLPADWADGIVARSLTSDARDTVWRKHYAPPHIDVQSALAHASETTAFGRAVFALAECRLVHNLETSWQKTVSRRHGIDPLQMHLPSLELDADFVILPDRVYIARLNEFDTALEIAFEHFPLILQQEIATSTDVRQ